MIGIKKLKFQTYFFYFFQFIIKIPLMYNLTQKYIHKFTKLFANLLIIILQSHLKFCFLSKAPLLKL
jgi:hypothetical protein